MAAHIRKLLVIKDERVGTWFNVFEAPGVDGKPVTAQVPREVRTHGRVAAELLNAGAVISSDDEEQVKRAIQQNAPVIYRRPQVGWVASGAAFVGELHIAYNSSTTIDYQHGNRLNGGSCVWGG